MKKDTIVSIVLFILAVAMLGYFISREGPIKAECVNIPEPKIEVRTQTIAIDMDGFNCDVTYDDYIDGYKGKLHMRDLDCERWESDIY